MMAVTHKTTTAIMIAISIPIPGAAKTSQQRKNRELYKPHVDNEYYY